tara:strand:- start:185 stop:2422 length:2238 start_codon:yes stop_codon:yes gene_type:complete
MDKFQIMTPDGYEVEISAPSQEEALEKAKSNYKKLPRIIKKMDGNVRIFERKDGQRYLVSPSYSTSDQDRINTIMAGETDAGQASKSSFYQDVLDKYPLASRAAAYLGATPFAGTYTDEAMGQTFGEQAAIATRAAQSAMASERPKENLAIGLGSGLINSAAMLAGLPAKATTALAGPLTQTLPAIIGRGVATGSGLGASEGLISGYGEGSTTQERIEGAKQGAMFGAAGGAVLGTAAPIVGKGVKNLADWVKQTDVGLISNALKISGNAARVIKNTFELGGNINSALSSIQRAGDEGMLADAGSAAQALLDASASSGGQASRVARTAVNERMARTGQNLNTTFDDVLGEAEIGPRTAVENIAKRTQAQRSDLYNKAFRGKESAIDYSSEKGDQIFKVLDRTPDNVLSKAIADANEAIQISGMPANQQIKVVVGDNGKIIFSELPNVMQLDQLKKSLQSIAYENVDDFGRLTGKGSSYNKLASDLRDAVSDAVPVYGDAVKLGGDKIAEERSFKLGADLLKPNTELEDVLDQFNASTPVAQLEAAKTGLRNYIDKAMNDVKAIASDPTAEAIDARQVIKVVTDLSSGSSRNKIKALLGAEADALLKQIDAASQSAVVKASMAVNSKTAQRTAINETIKEITKPGVVGTALRGEPLQTSQRLIQAISGMTDEFTESQKQKVFVEIATALTQRKGRSAQEALKLISGAVKGQDLTEAQNRFLAQQISVTLFGGATPTASEAASNLVN